ncbi:MAG: PilN domain-containing protein [Terriglobia bacterium]
MIRINLLGRPRPKVKRRIPIARTFQLALVAMTIGLALAFLIWHYTSIEAQIAEIQQRIDEQVREKERLQNLEAQVKEFQKQQANLQTQQNAIEELRRKQKGPVQLLDAIGETVSNTDTLWLTRLDERGDTITLEGMAGSVNAIAQFITNLKASGSFTNIEIKEVEQSTVNPAIENFTFSLTCTKVLPKLAEEPAVAAAAGT